MVRINRDAFDTHTVMELLNRRELATREVERLLEEACHVIIRQRVILKIVKEDIENLRFAISDVADCGNLR